jgi:hypothetical protein
LCQKNVQLVEKTLSLVKHSLQLAKHRRYSFSQDLYETLYRWPVALVKNLFGFPYALFGFLVGFSKKCAASQKNIQLVKITFNRCPGCQAPKLSMGQISRVSFIL